MRYAVYYAPAPGSDLALLGDYWLVRQNPLFEAPRRYGFHATLKAPFRLADGRKEADLLMAVNRLAQDLEATEIGKLEVSRADGFLSLRAQSWPHSAQAIADEVVVSLDHLRAPLTQAELDYRRKNKLTAAEEAMMKTYGYPHVLKEFRFHMTLTSSASPAELINLAAEAEEWFAVPLGQVHHLDRLSVVREPSPGAAFEPVEQFELRRAGPWPEVWKWSAA
jgi:2'-5' RNA ligase